MLKSMRSFTIWILLLIAVGPGHTAIANPVPSPGFLVIAPDRGYLGNEEIKTAWAEFADTHLTRLVFISLSEDYRRDVRATLQGAVAAMQREETTEIVLIPLMISEADPHLKRARDLLAKAKVRVAPVFGGSPLARQILEDRVRALSKEPGKERLIVIGFGATSREEAEAMTRELERLAVEVRETVILLAHGSGDDEDERFWIEQLEKRAEFIRKKAPAKFKAVKVATVREDWPEKSARAVAEVRKMIKEGSRENGRVLVVSNRIAGAGPYRKMLAGLDYTLNDQGIASHPHFTRWIEEQIENWIDATGLLNTPITRGGSN